MRFVVFLLSKINKSFHLVLCMTLFRTRLKYWVGGVLALGVLSTSVACTTASAPPPPTQPLIPAAQPVMDDEAATLSAIRFLEDRVKKDPDDFIAFNKLAERYLQKLRETGDLSYLDLASRTTQASLKAMPVEQNITGLSLQAQVECASHEFAAAREHAQKLVEFEPHKSYPYQILGEALIELGEYDQAGKLFKNLESRTHSVGTFIRMARLAQLNGKPAAAQENLAVALTKAMDQIPLSRENIAWCRWQLGEIAFSIGDLENAEKHDRDALTTFPNYYRALASLGRVLAARGDMTGAITHYEQAVKILPDPTFVAALGDLYKLAGREKEAAAQYELVEKIGHLSAINGAVYNRNLAMFYANHDLKPDEAYAMAVKEFEVRRDIYGADAVAWTALKARKVIEAQTAIQQALRLGTKDAMLFYHAGMIELAAGNKSAARKYLGDALKLNPHFDPLQAAIAQKAFAEAA